MAKTAFVTGGTGFVGINLIKSLCEDDWSVTALHRPTSNLKYLKQFPVRLAEGSVTDKSSLISAIPADTEVIFHVAGDTNTWSKHNARQTAINVDGTRNMVEAAADKGVQTFIHTSSISAWGPARGIIDENTPQKGAASWVNYEKTKWQAEREAFKGMTRGLKVIIINPGSIVGPYDTDTWATMFFALKAGQVPGVPPGTSPIVHVNDVVQAHMLAAEKGRNGHRYIIVGDHIPMKEFMAEVAKLLGLKKIPPEIPAIVLKWFGKIAVLGTAFTGKEPTITPEVAEMVTRKNLKFSNEKARAELGYQTTPWKIGVQECYHWLIQENLL